MQTDFYIQIQLNEGTHFLPHFLPHLFTMFCSRTIFKYPYRSVMISIGRNACTPEESST